MKRKIIKIDESLCDGCGDCVTGCAEGALQIINGVAKLVREDFCDGIGDCIGKCHSGALTIEERDADDFNEEAVEKHLLTLRKKDSLLQVPRQKVVAKQPITTGFSTHVMPSELEQWPVQLHLVNPASPFFSNKELVILSTCSPVACADIHWKYIRNRSVVIACPKLDKTDKYVEKLAAIFKREDVPKIIILRMTVPCCGGLTLMTKHANQMSGRNNLVIEEHTMNIKGEIESVKNI